MNGKHFPALLHATNIQVFPDKLSCLFLVFISHVIKTINRNRSTNKLKNLDMTDDCNVNNLTKNQVSVVFNSRAIRRSVSSKFVWRRHVGAHPDGHQHVNLVKVKYQHDQ